MDHTTRFDGKGEVYAKGRPKYAAGLLTYLKDTLGIPAGSVFADVGAGTGIFTEQLLQCGYQVFAVEPNPDMRKKAEEKLSQVPGFCAVDGNASHTGLPECSVDHVTAAQAFHWFDPEDFRQECRRIVKPGESVMLVYNFRNVQAPCTKDLAALQRTCNPSFPGFSNGMDEETCRAFFSGKCSVYRADNTQVYDRQGYIDRVMSSSYSPGETDNGYEEYLRSVHRIFDRYAADGRIAVPADTVAYIGTI